MGQLPIDSRNEICGLRALAVRGLFEEDGYFSFQGLMYSSGIEITSIQSMQKDDKGQLVKASKKKAPDCFNP